MSDSTGISTIPNRIIKKTVKNGFNFKLMVVGESGLGKSTLINSLFLTDLYSSRVVPPCKDRIKSTMKMKTSSVEMVENGIKLTLTVVDTPGFADSVDSSKDYLPIVQYIDRQFEKYMSKETGILRRNITDTRVHCCLYFINPSGKGLRSFDVRCLYELHERVNIIPVIGKADTLTKSELYSLKETILDDLRKNHIKIYDYPKCHVKEADEIKLFVQELESSIPYAVIGSDTVFNVDGRRVRGRIYPWGVVDIENPDYCDFIKVRNMLVTFMDDMIDVTHDLHYENYRSNRVVEFDNIDTLLQSAKEMENYLILKGCGNCLINHSSLIKIPFERDNILEKKDIELKMMQEKIEKLQIQISAQI